LKYSPLGSPRSVSGLRTPRFEQVRRSAEARNRPRQARWGEKPEISTVPPGRVSEQDFPKVCFDTKQEVCLPESSEPDGSRECVVVLIADSGCLHRGRLFADEASVPVNSSLEFAHSVNPQPSWIQTRGLSQCFTLDVACEHGLLSSLARGVQLSESSTSLAVSKVLFETPRSAAAKGSTHGWNPRRPETTKVLATNEIDIRRLRPRRV